MHTKQLAASSSAHTHAHTYTFHKFFEVFHSSNVTSNEQVRIIALTVLSIYPSMSLAIYFVRITKRK